MDVLEILASNQPPLHDATEAFGCYIMMWIVLVFARIQYKERLEIDGNYEVHSKERNLYYPKRVYYERCD